MPAIAPRRDRVPILAVLALLVALPAAADWMGFYLPLWVGNSWTYENVDLPGDIFIDTVFGTTVYGGQTVALLGEPGDYTVLGNTGRVITGYAQTQGGELVEFDPPIVLGEFADGDFFEICVDAVCDTSLIRDWEAVDPALRAMFGLDPAYDDVVLLVSYDGDDAPNLANIVAESNLPPGAEPPAGAVTSLEWYQRGLGMIAITDVDAQSGGLVDYYQLVDHAIGVADRATLPAAALLGTSYPNPFNPRTVIPYTLTRDAVVQLEIRDLAGRLVRTLASGARGAGEHEATWDGRDDRGREQPSGTYLASLQVGATRQTVKLVLMR